MSTQLIQPLVIAGLVVTEVAVWQLRVALATRGRKNLAATLGAVNAVLSVVALAQVVTHLERPANVAGYAVGVAVGVYLGVVADERLTREPLEYRVLVDGDGTSWQNSCTTRAGRSPGSSPLVRTFLRRCSWSWWTPRMRRLGPETRRGCDDSAGVGRMQP